MVSANFDPTQYISHDDFNKLLDKQVKFVVDYVDREKNKADVFVPMVVIVGREVDENTGQMTEQIGIATLPLEDFDTRKREYIEEIGREYFKTKEKGAMPVAVFFMSEAWIAEVDKDDEEAMNKVATEGISGRSDKLEVAVVHGMTFDKRYNMSTVRLVRNVDETFSGTVTHKHAPYNPAMGNETESPLLSRFYVGYAKALKEHLGEK